MPFGKLFRSTNAMFYSFKISALRYSPAEFNFHRLNNNNTRYQIMNFRTVMWVTGYRIKIMSCSRPAISSVHGLAKCFLVVVFCLFWFCFSLFLFFFFLIISTIDVLKEGKEFQTIFTKEVVLLH